MVATLEKSSSTKLSCSSEASASGVAAGGWLALHFYYHEDLDRLARGCVNPLIHSLVEQELVSSFHFLRYSLGGPHIRTRFQVEPGNRQRVLEQADRMARSFFATTPSQSPFDPEELKEINARILDNDPNEKDTTVFADNSYREAPFHPEIDRYGGSEILPSSLSFFTLSSLGALDFLHRFGHASRPSQLAYAFKFLVKQALGFADNERELAWLLGYGIEYWGEKMPTILEKADWVAETKKDLFLRLVTDSLKEHTELADAPLPEELSPLDFLVVGSSRLSSYLTSEGAPNRLGIGRDHLHMTSSRIGLRNSEEVYLSQLIVRSLEEARTEISDFFATGAAGSFPDLPGSALQDLLPAAFQNSFDLSEPKAQTTLPNST